MTQRQLASHIRQVNSTRSAHRKIRYQGSPVVRLSRRIMGQKFRLLMSGLVAGETLRPYGMCVIRPDGKVYNS